MNFGFNTANCFNFTPSKRKLDEDDNKNHKKIKMEEHKHPLKSICSICEMEFNEKSLITCFKCNTKTCLNCTKQMLLGQFNNYHCSNCDVNWNFNFIYSILPKSFITNELKANYGNICFDADLQFKIPKVKNIYTLCVKIYNTYLHALKGSFDIIQKNKEISDALNNMIVDTFDIIDIFNIFNFTHIQKSFCYFNGLSIAYDNHEYQNITELFDYVFLLFAYLKDKDNEYLKVYNEYKLNKYISSAFDKLKDNNNYEFFVAKIIYKSLKQLKIKKNVQHTYHPKCFSNFCIGDIFKVDNHYVCNLCDKLFCLKCHQELLPNHVCKEEDIETVKLLSKSKPCPKCGEAIEKTFGCDDMWCVRCQTSFNYSNLKITKTTTNPHYYEWLRKQRNSNGHISSQSCDRQLNAFQCKEFLKTLNIDNDEIKRLFINATYTLELIRVYLNKESIKDIRIKFIFGLIDAQQFKLLLSKYHIDNYFKSQYNDIILNTVSSVSGLFNDMMHDKLVKSKINYYFDVLKQIYNIHNSSVCELFDIYPNLDIQLIDLNFCDYKRSATAQQKAKNRKLNIPTGLLCQSPFTEISHDKFYRLLHAYSACVIIHTDKYIKASDYVKMLYPDLKVLNSPKVSDFIEFIYDLSQTKCSITPTVKEIKHLLINYKHYDVKKANFLHNIISKFLFDRANCFEETVKKFIKDIEFLKRNFSKPLFVENHDAFVKRVNGKTIKQLKTNMSIVYEIKGYSFLEKLKDCNLKFEHFNHLLTYFNSSIDKGYLLLFESKIYEIIIKLLKDDDKK